MVSEMKHFFKKIRFTINLSNFHQIVRSWNFFYQRRNHGKSF
nr:MAG TPA: hypothetical protein [Caudoviricetes sp.]